MNLSLINFLIAMPGGSEWIMIIIVILLLFGGTKIPQLMRGLGKGVREFKDAKSGMSDESERNKTEKNLSSENNVNA